MSTSTHKFLKYWRNTLADASRGPIDLKQKLHTNDCDIDIQAGRVDAAQANTLIDNGEKKLNTDRGREDAKSPEWQRLEEVGVLISLFFLNPRPEYAINTGENGPHHPFWVAARLNRLGILKVSDDAFPYVPRIFLEPQTDPKVNYMFSTVDKVDIAFAETFKEDNWGQYWAYLQVIFEKLAGVQINNYTADNFEVTRTCTIALNTKEGVAGDGIIKLYDYLIKSEVKLPTLLKDISEPDNSELKPLRPLQDFEDLSLKHLGQMGFEHALSYTQRRSLYHFYSKENGNVLAINGPPGTGKTTLLQSVVANEVVNGALEGKSPRLIVACSTNNQAVKNIIESFGEVKAKDGALYRRWIPEIQSFALYVPSQSQEIKEGVHYFKSLFDYSFQKLNTNEFLERATKVFETNFLNCFGTKLSVKESIDFLHTRLSQMMVDLDNGMSFWKNYKKISLLIDKLKAPSTIFVDYNLDTASLKTLNSNLLKIEEAVSNYMDKESFLIKLFSWLPFVREKRAARLKVIFRSCPIPHGELDFYDLKTFHIFFDRCFGVIQDVEKKAQDWQNWKTANNISGNPATQEQTMKQNNAPFYYDELEKGIKYDMFYTAIHYWEGRWIIETENALSRKTENKTGKENALARWQRFAMLTPCFVSTFFMAPKHFTYSKFLSKTGSKQIYEYPPLLECFDLLIVDEAGQVSPEVGVATFALAKHAIVVGDTQQIEPVWNVPFRIDYANLARFEIVRSTTDLDAIEDLKNRGFLGSSGSIMKLGQKASRFQLSEKHDRGMYLVEHRRCFDEIISYCNELAYQGFLEPLKGKSKNALFPPMHFIPVAGNSSLANSSRINEQEAKQIALWLKENFDNILGHYNSQMNRKDPKLLHDLVAILTPFSAQRVVLKMALKKIGIDTGELIIGTVHALQGAEKPIVLFSPVYGENDIGGSFFFDRNISILNVAVSRAQESFIVFGNDRVFNSSKGYASSLLYRHMQRVSTKNTSEVQ